MSNSNEQVYDDDKEEDEVEVNPDGIQEYGADSEVMMSQDLSSTNPSNKNPLDPKFFSDPSKAPSKADAYMNQSYKGNPQQNVGNYVNNNSNPQGPPHVLQNPQNPQPPLIPQGNNPGNSNPPYMSHMNMQPNVYQSNNYMPGPYNNMNHYGMSELNNTQVFMNKVDINCEEHRNRSLGTSEATRFCTQCKIICCDSCVIEYHNDHIAKAKIKIEEYFSEQKKELEELIDSNKYCIEHKRYLAEVDKRKEKILDDFNQYFSRRQGAYEAIMTKITDLAKEEKEIKNQLCESIEFFYKQECYKRIDNPIKALNNTNDKIVEFLKTWSQKSKVEKTTMLKNLHSLKVESNENSKIITENVDLFKNKSRGLDKSIEDAVKMFDYENVLLETANKFKDLLSNLRGKSITALESLKFGEVKELKYEMGAFKMPQPEGNYNKINPQEVKGNIQSNLNNPMSNNNMNNMNNLGNQYIGNNMRQFKSEPQPVQPMPPISNNNNNNNNMNNQIIYPQIGNPGNVGNMGGGNMNPINNNFIPNNPPQQMGKIGQPGNNDFNLLQSGVPGMNNPVMNPQGVQGGNPVDIIPKLPSKLDLFKQTNKNKNYIISLKQKSGDMYIYHNGNINVSKLDKTFFHQDGGNVFNTYPELAKFINLGEGIFLTGGNINKQLTPNCYTILVDYDPNSKKYIQSIMPYSNMNEKRDRHNIIYIESRSIVVVCCGISNNKAEMTDMNKGTWDNLPALSEIRSNATMACVNERFVYCFGGFKPQNKEGSYLNSYEYIDMNNTSAGWVFEDFKKFAPASLSLSAIGVIRMNQNTIFFCGGYDGTNYLSDVTQVTFDLEKGSIASHEKVKNAKLPSVHIFMQNSFGMNGDFACNFDLYANLISYNVKTEEWRSQSLPK